MSKTKVFQKKVEEGNEDAIKLTKFIYFKEIMIDMFESISEEMVELHRSVGLYRYEDKRDVEIFLSASRRLARSQRKYIGEDKVAETLGEASDGMRDIIDNTILISPWKRKLVAEFANKLSKVKDEDEDALTIRMTLED